ncbi:MAG: nitroreductase family protein [Candidatus Bathyarchaeia archaeon]
MSTLRQVIRQRRSIRKYSPRSVPMDALGEILSAAAWAPSAHNSQPWRFIVLTDASAKRKLAEHMAEAWLRDLEKDGVSTFTAQSHAKASVERFTRAPVLVVACITMEDMDCYPDKKRQNSERDLALHSLAAAVQNLLLAAHAEGLGACWYCTPAFCQEEVRKALGIPKDVEPQALVAVGYPAENPSTPRRKPLRDVAFMDCWGKPF